MIELETNRLVMRPWRPADLDGIAEIFGQEETAQYIGGLCSRDEAWRRMATVVGHWTLRGFGLWVLEEKSSGAFVGSSGLWYPEGWPEMEAGWWVLPAKQKQGYATEAARRARLYAYQVLGASTLVSYIHPNNKPSQRVAERLGAHFEKKIELRGVPACVYRHPSAQQILAQEVITSAASS